MVDVRDDREVSNELGIHHIRLLRAFFFSGKQGLEFELSWKQVTMFIENQVDAFANVLGDRYLGTTIEFLQELLLALSDVDSRR